MHDWIYVAAGYSITFAAIAAYRARIWRAGVAAKRRSINLREERPL